MSYLLFSSIWMDVLLFPEPISLMKSFLYFILNTMCGLIQSRFKSYRWGFFEWFG